MTMDRKVRSRRWSWALGTSFAAMAAGWGAPAAAQCTPDPTVANGTTNCTGTDSDGLSVTTSGTNVVVAAGAVVQPGAAAAAITTSSGLAYVTVNGRVDGGSKTGLLVTTPAPYVTTGACDPYAGASPDFSLCTPGLLVYPSASSTIMVGAGAVVTGSQAVLAQRLAGGTSNFINLSLSNAGTLIGSAGPAVVLDTGSALARVDNLASGRIGGIAGTLGSIFNMGTVDGGTIAAIAATGSSLTVNNEGSGRVVSAAGTTTVSSAGELTVNNAAGATIGGGSVALSAAGRIILTNYGTINGSVVSTAVPSPLVLSASTINTVQGTINGNLALGSGDDTLRVRYDPATGRISSITGTIDGGAGIDTLVIGVDRDLTLGSAALPTNFELLGFDLSNNAAVTLSAAFPSIGVSMNGSGSLTNLANLVTTGPAITSGFSQSLSFTNQASISATLSQATQFAVAGPGTITNNGTIAAAGGGGARASNTLINNGTITATGTAATADFGTLTNAGTIRSTGGVGASITGQASYLKSTNSGSISGATIGARISNGQLVNGSTITGGGTGVALDYSGTLVNNAGAIVSGGTNGVSNVGYNVRILNAGTINGDVNLASTLTFDNSEDIFVDNGGTVNGAVRLGAGNDLLVVDLVSVGGRPFAGATGGVDAGAGYDTVRYRVSADASAGLSIPGGFEALAYELDNKAALTLTAAQPITTTIGLAGNGSVTLGGSIATSDRTLIDATISTVDQLTGGGAGPARALSIVNNGTLTLSSTQPFAFAAMYAVNAGTADFTNNGTIAASSTAGSYYPANAIFGGNKVTNAGTITLTGGTAISNAIAIVNSGTITDIAGSKGNGILTFTTLNNSGTIRVDQTALQLGFDNSKATNSGTIESRLGAAVTMSSNGTLINEATGSITGKTNVVTLSGGTILNRGAMVGDIRSGDFAFAGESYVSDGGTLTGNVALGAGNDAFVQFGTGSSGVTGTIDGGTGEDVYGYVLKTSGSVSLDARTQATGFENRLVQAAGSDTTATITASTPFAGSVYLSGDGKIVNQASITGQLRTGLGGQLDQVLSTYGYALGSFDNEGTLGGGVQAAISNFTNKGSITGATGTSSGVNLTSTPALSFTNSGQIDLSGGSVALSGSAAVSLINSGTIKTNAAGVFVQSSAGPISVDNSGTMAVGGTQGGTALRLSGAAYGLAPYSFDISNSGTITASGFGAQAVLLFGSAGAAATITNTSTGVISGAGSNSAAIVVYDAALTIDNAGTISAGAGGTAIQLGQFLTLGAQANQIRNTGTITGTIRLGGGDDLIENHGTIDGNVFLGAGNDSFLQLAGSVTGRVDGGTGFDTLTIDTAQSGTIDASRFLNFERFTQTGSGNATYNGAFAAQSFGISGGSLTVAEGASLTSSDAVTVGGSSNSEELVNSGTISGSVAMGGGNDMVVNRGRIGGAVILEDGDDSFTETAAGSVTGVIDGGAGTDTYVIELAGDRACIGARTNFEILGVTGNGTLALTLDQSWQQVMLSGTNLNLNLGGFSLGSLTGGAAAEQVAVDGDLANAALGGGDDRLTLGTATLAGSYDGGAGANMLRTTAAGPVTLSGTVSNFSSIDVGNVLAVTGTLNGAQGGTTLAGSGHIVSFERGAITSGLLSLGAGANTLRILAGSTVGGAIAGGDGSGATALQIVNDGGTLPIAASFSGFDVATLTGGGTVQINGAWTVGGMSFDGNLTVGANGSLASPSLTGSAGANILALAGRFSGAIDLGAGNDTLRLAGAFAPGGSVTGGAGTDTLELAVSGTNDAPTNLGSTAFASFETLKAVSGVSILGGTQSFANGVEIGAGARLIGAAGSVFTAPQFTVATGGTFGTAGTVNGNVAVAGTLSPGASPGTMTVNGNVALAAGSNALFELTSAVSDQLLVSGNLTIASGATLTLTGNRPLTPGVTLDLIIANGGITGSFSTVNQAAGVGGFLSQSANRISLLGTFLTSSAFSPQVNRAITGVNNLLISGKANAAVLAGVPKLISNGAADAAAFARISPEPFAAATSLATEDGLSLIDATRSQARTSPTSTGLFSFAQGLGTRYRVRGSAGQGINSARLSSSGGFAGIGLGAEVASIGAFVGYGQSRQHIGALGSSLDGDGLMAGVQASASFAGFTINAVSAYSDRAVKLSRAAPQGGTQSHFHLRDTLGDLTASYSLPLAPAWSVKPRIGLSYIHVERGRVAETGSSPFTLQLASGKANNWFADAGLDLAGGAGPFRAFAGVALRQRLNSRQNDVDARFTGTDSAITALGATSDRTSVLGSAGASFSLTPRLSLSAGYTGAFSHTTRHTGTLGLRFAM
jgi:hypothetical protein